jgi:hypothetical protein
MLTVSAVGGDNAVLRGCTLNATIDWAAQTRVRIIFDIAVCYGPCDSWSGPGDVREHAYLEPFRPMAATTARSPPDLWWISREMDYGYGLYSGFSVASGLHRSTINTSHNPNDWHTWDVIFHNPGSGSNLFLEEWTIDGASAGVTAAYQGATTPRRTSWTKIGFAVYAVCDFFLSPPSLPGAAWRPPTSLGLHTGYNGAVG